MIQQWYDYENSIPADKAMEAALFHKISNPASVFLNPYSNHGAVVISDEALCMKL